MLELLQASHVAVLGYWLGAEFVINGTFRHVSFAAAMPYPARDRLMAHVMDMDQHVRYALVLQAGLGGALALLEGYLPGGPPLAAGVALAAGAWLGLVEVVHRTRRFAGLDRGVRVLVMLLLVAVAAAALSGALPVPAWLALKLALFAGVIACGLWIRQLLAGWFATWGALGRGGPADVLEARLRAGYWRATAVLVLLWLLIAGIVALSVARPDWAVATSSPA